MAKNNALISHYKNVYKQIQHITPDVYASVALALSRYHGWGYDEINELFLQSQNIWTECVQSSNDMVAMCEEETGIELRAK